MHKLFRFVLIRVGLGRVLAYQCEGIPYPAMTYELVIIVIMVKHDKHTSVVLVLENNFSLVLVSFDSSVMNYS